MVMLGANTEQLRQLGDRFKIQRDLTESSRRKVEADVSELRWEGQDANKFRHDVDTLLVPMLRQLESELHQRVDQLEAQAADQDDTSAARSQSTRAFFKTWVGGAFAADAGSQEAPATAIGHSPAMDISAVIRELLFPDPIEQRPRATPLPLDQRPNLTEIQEQYQVAEDATVTVDIDGEDYVLTRSEAAILAAQSVFGNGDRIREIKALADETGAQNTDGHGDAMRHTYLNALLASELSPEAAYALATAHEQKPDNDARAEAMDLYNNEVGRAIAASHPDASREELAALVEQASRNGELVVIGPDLNLAWSDQVAPGDTGLVASNPQADPPGEPVNQVGEGRPGLDNPYAL